MGDKLPWMPFYGYDFFNDERVLSLDECSVGIYVRMLWQQWVEGSLPASSEDVTRIIRSEYPDLVRDILETFFDVSDDGRAVNTKLAEIREMHVRRLRGKSLGGKRSRRVLQQSSKSPERLPGENQNQNQNQNQKPTTSAPVLTKATSTPKERLTAPHDKKTQPTFGDAVNDVLGEVTSG